MSKRVNFINNVLVILFTLASAFAIAYVCGNRYIERQSYEMVLWCVLGLVITSFICTLCHELGHVISAKKNGFVVLSFSVWFFKWTKKKKSYKFSFTSMSEAGGNTETVPTSTENLAKRLKKMTISGTIAVILPCLLGLVPIFITNTPFVVFCIFSTFLPVGIYSILTNILPMESLGYKNDGALVLALKKGEDSAKVLLSVLAIQTELYNGKTPSQIDEKFYFDNPQLAEDSPYFIMLLDAKYNYYLDKEDYENAKKTIKRLRQLEGYMPTSVKNQVLTNALYEYCTYNYSANKADDCLYELERYLNSNNSVLSVRAKTAYVVFVKKDRERFEAFYQKGIKECKKCKIKGIGEFNKKLFNQIKEKM